MSPRQLVLKILSLEFEVMCVHCVCVMVWAIRGCYTGNECLCNKCSGAQFCIQVCVLILLQL